MAKTMIPVAAVLLFGVFFFLESGRALAGAVEHKAQGIVVWRLEPKTGVTEKDIDSISGFVTAEVERHSGLNAVSDADIKTILAGEEKKLRCGAESTSCIAEISGALGVPEAVSGDLGRMGDYWILNLRRINVAAASVRSRVGRQIKGDVNALIEGIPSAVAELFGKEPARPAAAGPKAEPPEEKPGSSVLKKAALWTFFSGVAIVGLGGFGHWRMAEAKEDGRSGDPDAKERHGTWKGVAVAGYATGAAAVAAGVALWIMDAAGGKKPGEQPAVQAGVSALGNGLAAGLCWRW